MSYVRHAFLHDVYEPWVGLEGSEWGEAMSGLLRAYDPDMWDDSDLEDINRMLRLQLDAMGPFGDNHFEDYYGKYLDRVYAQVNEAIEYWHDRAISFHGQVEYDIALAELPKWMIKRG